MPTIFQPDDLPVSNRNQLRITTLANRAMLNADALQVEHIRLEKGAASAPFEAVKAERFLYVVRGKGQAQAGGKDFALEPESVLWLEEGDTFSLRTDAEELEVLLCRAPAGE